MSYTRLKSLFGRLSRRNSSASETSRPTSPAPSPSLRPASPAPAHSPLQHESDVHPPSPLILTVHHGTETDRFEEPASAPNQTHSRPWTDSENLPLFSSQDKIPVAPPGTPIEPLSPKLPQTAPLPAPTRRPSTHRRHSSSFSIASNSASPSSSPSGTAAVPAAVGSPPRHRRPTNLALRASSLGRYPITSESALAAQGEHVNSNLGPNERRVASMSSVEREEERGGGSRAGRDEGRTRERGRERKVSSYHEGDDREGSESSRGAPDGAAGSGGVGGASKQEHPPPNRSARAFSFISNLTKRARPALSLGGSSSGPGSGTGAKEIVRRVSGIFEHGPTDSDASHHAHTSSNLASSTTAPSLSTSHALIPFSKAGTFPSHLSSFTTAATPKPLAVPTTAVSTATSHAFAPDADTLPVQPIEVLLLALTTPPAPDEPSASCYDPTILARQLAKQLRNPTNLRGGVGVGMVGIGGREMVGAGVLGDVVRCLRKAGARGSWEVVGAWVEGDPSTSEIGGRGGGATGAKKAGTTIERALLWSALTSGEEEKEKEGVFDPEEWAERDRTTKALTDGGRDVLGLHRFVRVVGGWVGEACAVVAGVAGQPNTIIIDKESNDNDNEKMNIEAPVYVEAQKCIDASLRLLEDTLRHNAPRFDEAQVVQVVEVFCQAVERTLGAWSCDLTSIAQPEGETVASPGGLGEDSGKLAGGDEKARAKQGRVGGIGVAIHRRHPSSLSSPLASPTAVRSAERDPSRANTLDNNRSNPQDANRANHQDASRNDVLSAPYVVTASRFVALVRALQKWTHVPPQVLQMMLDHLSLVLAYVKTPMEVLRLGGRRRKSGAGIGGSEKGGKGSEVNWVDAYSRAELEGEVSGAFKVLLSGPYAVAVGRMLLGLLVPVTATEDTLGRSALVALGACRAIRLSVREAAIPRMARMRFQREPGSWTMTGVPSSGSDHISSTHAFKSNPNIPPFLSSTYSSRRGSGAGIDTASTPTSTTPNLTTATLTVSDVAEMELMELMFNREPDGASGAWETDRIVGVLGAAFSAWLPSLFTTGPSVEAVLIEMLGIVDDLLQEAAEDEKAFGIEEGRVVGEVLVAAVQLLPIYDLEQHSPRILDIVSNSPMDFQPMYPLLQTLVGVIRKIGLSTPITPPLINTLFTKSAFLTDNSAVAIIRHYVSMSLITPSTPDYLDNLRQLFDHFYKPERHSVRVELAQVVSKLYFGVRDLSEHRRGVVGLCLDVWEADGRNLVREPELSVVLHALKVLGDAVVAGSVESDGRGDTEERLRLLISLIGRDADCPSLRLHEEPSHPEAVLPPTEGQSRTRDSSPKPMMSLLNALTPTVLTPRDLPSNTGALPRAGPSQPSITPPSTCVQHVEDCKAMAAVVTLISAFSALAFSPPHSLASAERTARAPASFQCILVMRDLLALLSPVRGATLDPGEEAAEERSRTIDGQSCCSFARLSILQWLVRLRADRDHRLYMVKDLDKEIEPFASLINRTPNKPKQADLAPTTEPARVRDRERDRERRNRGMTITANAPDAARIGRNPSRGRESNSRSRSRQPPVIQVPPSIRHSIWSVPELLPFEVSFGTRPSEGMTTYEQRIEPGEDGLIPQLWLPVSAYVCIMIDLITTETDWEILSYALCHLPLQMSNKHLFCGPRTRNAIIRLLSELCTVLYDDKLTKNIGLLPAGLKVTDVQGLAYHTLTTLMSYHRTFDKRLQDALLQTFLRGLNKNTTTVKPCLQALAVAAFELQPSMTKFLGEIVDKLSQIMSNPTIAGFILELLCIIGSLPVLYANFTDDNYRRVFHVPLQYITLHNRPDSHAGPAGKESYALTQHVLIMAYYQIYIWFLALKLQDRPKHIAYITRHLLLANEHYAEVDEPTEVCFDWLARFTYANVESKPRMSSLRESVLNPPGSTGDAVVASKSWVFGNSIITIKTLHHSGWLEIECRRPSGLSSFLCKLENVAALGLGEQVTGEIVEAAAEAVRREPSDSSEFGNEPASNNDQLASDSVTNHTSTPSGLLSPSGVAAPKDMELDPSYFALQLSPYPDIRRASLRGRLVANDDLLNRTLRGLDRVPVMDFHAVGILYVGPGQTDEREILGNRAGSPAYTEFLDNLGRLIRLKDQRDLYTGGLDSHYDSDGQYAYTWWDVIGQVLYHTATLMPNREGDDQFASKKLHIGNDFVRIIWNDSGKPYRFDTLSTQFQYVNVVIEPHSLGTMAAFTSNAHQDEFFKVLLQRAPGMPDFGMIGEFKIVSAKCLPNVIRQISMLADFFAQIYVHTRHDTVREEYITPWRQRLRQIRMFKGRLPPLVVEEPAEGILGQELARDFSRSY